MYNPECTNMCSVGHCGISCHIYQDGECGVPDELLESNSHKMTLADLTYHYELYPNSYYGSGELKFNGKLKEEV